MRASPSFGDDRRRCALVAGPAATAITGPKVRQDQINRILGSARPTRDARFDIAHIVRLLSDDLAIAWRIAD